jgi:hypothetical protein
MEISGAFLKNDLICAGADQMMMNKNNSRVKPFPFMLSDRQV